MCSASDLTTLVQAVKEAFKFDSRILIEAFIDGPEYTVAILEKSALPTISMKSASGFYDYEAKYQSNTTQYFCPSGLNENDEQALRTLCVKAFNGLKCSGWGRVDVMRDVQNEFILLECNTVPGMTETSLVPKAAKQAGLSFADLVIAILNSSFVDDKSHSSLV